MISFPRPETKVHNPQPLAVRIKEAAQMLSISEWGIRKLIAAGKIKVRKIGTNVLIPVSELEKLLRDEQQP